MLDDIFAYYLGKSAGRNQARRRRRRRRALTKDDVVRARLVFTVVCVCIFVAIVVALVGSDPY